MADENTGLTMPDSIVADFLILFIVLIVSIALSCIAAVLSKGLRRRGR
ncbi:MAG: hypothetical protein AB7P23_04675 [Amphiplicatus sp.]